MPQTRFSVFIPAESGVIADGVLGSASILVLSSFPLNQGSLRTVVHPRSPYAPVFIPAESGVIADYAQFRLAKAASLHSR